MARRLFHKGIISGVFVLAILSFPLSLMAEGLSLIGDFDYFSIDETSTEKETGIVTDTEFFRFSQLYKLDMSRFIFPYLEISLGGYFENEDVESTISTVDEPSRSSERTERTIRPYLEVNLLNPLYRAGLAYRQRTTETSGVLAESETLNVDEFNARLQWRPVDFPLLNIDFQHVDLNNDPQTFDTTRETLNLLSKYSYKDFNFLYSYINQDNLNNIEDTGSTTTSHKAGVGYNRGFVYKNNRFDVHAGGRFNYDKVEFIGSVEDESLVDRPAANAGSPFYILNDSPPSSNEPFDLTLVEGGNQLTNVNIGRGGGLVPVSAGLSFGTPTDVDTIYIQLSQDNERFPELASSTQVSAIASSFTWQVYSSEDQVEFNWTLQPVSSAIYDIVNNRFEIRLTTPVNARRIKVTTIPLDQVAPGEIRYQAIRALISLSGREGDKQENIEQFYNFRLQWTPSSKTTMGYESHYRHQETEPDNSGRTSLVNSIFFRHVLNPIFHTYGKVYRDSSTRTTQGGDIDVTNLTYSLALKGDYLETLSQSLVFTGTDDTGSGGDSSTNSILLRTDAELYEGWTSNLDLGYSFNTLQTGADQNVKRLRLGTIIEPNYDLTLSLDYSISFTEETGRVDSTQQYGTFQILWALTDTLNMFFRYNFRDQEGESEVSTFQRTFNINWSPFPGGDIQFTIGYDESTDIGDIETKTISPVLSWKIGRGIFFDLRYNNGTTDSPIESTEFNSILAKLRFFY